jgi:hypothetical protein
MTNSNPNPATRFGTGNSGRPKGARNKLAAQFVENLAEDFEQHGAAVIKLVRAEHPQVYFTTMAKLLPKEMAVAMQVNQAHGPTAEEWPMMREIIDAIEVAGLGNRQPGEVFEMILHALRSETAKLIEPTPAVVLPPPPYGAGCAHSVLVSNDDK